MKDDFYIKYGNKIIVFLIIFGVVGFVFLAFIYPSYLSVTHYYSEDYDEIVSNKKGGGLYYPTTDEIVVFEKNGSISYGLTYLHELCHREQHYENRSGKNWKEMYKNEFECNIKEFYIWRWDEIEW